VLIAGRKMSRPLMLAGSRSRIISPSEIGPSRRFKSVPGMKFVHAADADQDFSHPGSMLSRYFVLRKQ
jgi:hypothetical protein